MITPRVTRLVRVPDLKAMHAAIARLACTGLPSVRRTAVIVPTRGAAEELRRTLENALLRADTEALLLPDLMTRADLYERLHAAMPSAPPLLTPQEREVLLRKASRHAAAAGTPPPFSLRPGLIVQMLAFYDELRRREQSLDDFHRLTTERLGPSAETDRGAERLLRQTEFMAASFARFEHLTHETGGIDEHGLRILLLDTSAEPQAIYDRIIITIGDQAADARGLYASDFGLLTRISGIERIEVVATENFLASGWHERIHDLLPGVEEERLGTAAEFPTLISPETSEPDQYWFVCRDREEELAEFVRELKHRSASAHAAVRPAPLERCGLVFQRPLPYLYLAKQVFDDGGVAHQAADALPLSGEPFAAAVDLVMSFLLAEGNRVSSVALLSSPHFRMLPDAGAESIEAMDQLLRDLKFSGGWDRLAAIATAAADEHGTTRQKNRRAKLSRRAAPALASAQLVATALAPLRDEVPASLQLEALAAFLHNYEVQPDPADPASARHLRARARILSAISALRDAHGRHDDDTLAVAELAGSLRRWIEAETFSPRLGRNGVRLIDASSAAYADVDEVRLIGLVESDWPEPAKRSIFYPASILSQLGWPADAARALAARARFHDLLTLPTGRISASTFTLEEDAIVPGSPFLEEVGTAGLPIERQPPFPAARVFAHEALLQGGTSVPAGRRHSLAAAAEWLALRVSRTGGDDRRYHGAAGPRAPVAYAVSAVERYLECPFKYYAAQVLKLPEERDEESGLSPLERGHFVHDVFEQFFIQWYEGGRGSITTANVADAIALFERVVESRLDTLPEADRALERTHLLGSAAASGLAERAFAFEIEQGGEVVERLLEHELEGTFEFAGTEGPRSIALRAKADRIDLMADGTLRIVDYKLSKAPNAARALQLPIYGVCAEQALAGRRGRSWKLGRAGYVAFKEKDPFVPLGGRMPLAEAIADGQTRFLGAIDGIERGDFPVRPDEPFRCRWCAYAGVCRKDYVGDE
ncbi:MAG: PD-(D/E)XK nuclease family protein [Vicinamibacterales bacterium]